MKFCVCGLAMAGGVLWGLAILLVGLINRWSPDYGLWFLKMTESLYPGYHATTGLKNLAIGVVYALVDGAVAGALFAWLYNRVVTKCFCGKEETPAKCD